MSSGYFIYFSKFFCFCFVGKTVNWIFPVMLFVGVYEISVEDV